MRIGLVVAIATASACTVPNPDWCDATHPCSAGRTCDLVGKGGVRNLCVAALSGDGGPAPDAAIDARLDAGPPDAPPPDAPVTCADAGGCPATLPICRQGLCTGCRSSDECVDLTSPVCIAGGLCGPCKEEKDCMDRHATPHCGGGGACVECRDDRDCPMTKPVCDGAGACQPCRVDGDCPDLCDVDSGACVRMEDLLFVAAGQTGDCKKATPCGSVASALGKVNATKKWWIKIGPGTYSEALQIKAVAVELVGPGASIVPVLSAGSPAVLVQAGATVTLRGLRLTGANGGPFADGLLCEGEFGATTGVTMREVTLDSNGARGVDATKCAIVLDRSTVTRNGGGGVALAGSDFTLVNDLIVNNGGATAAFGGVLVDGDPPSGPTAARLLFTTIAKNSAPGVACNSQTMPLTFADAIVYDNGAGAQVSGDRCAWVYSDIGPTGVDGNLNVDPMFVDPSTNKYQLQPQSKCIDAADPATTVTIDIDGHPRPVNGRADIGAYEAQ
jgi:hypothetical protein